MDRPLKVRVVCTARGAHRETRLADGYLHGDQFTWKNRVDIYAAAAWKGEPGYVGERYRFPRCNRCGLHGVTLRADTLAEGVGVLAAATHRDKALTLDLSLLA